MAGWLADLDCRARARAGADHLTSCKYLAFRDIGSFSSTALNCLNQMRSLLPCKVSFVAPTLKFVNVYFGVGCRSAVIAQTCTVRYVPSRDSRDINSTTSDLAQPTNHLTLFLAQERPPPPPPLTPPHHLPLLPTS